MKLLKNKIFYNNFSILIRNFLNIRPVAIHTENINFTCSISDAFCWRTDKNYKTIFKYSDILKIFENIDSSFIEISFYLKNGSFLKKIKISSLDFSNQLIIDKNFFYKEVEDYGTFYIHHFTKENNIKTKTIYSNRCYIGYSLNNNLYSFMHGNTIASIKRIDDNDKEVLNHSINVSPNMMYDYKIQKNFRDYEYVELFFSNPTHKTIKFKINNGTIQKLKKRESKFIKIDKNDTINIRSNCSFLRPSAFNYRKEYIDVHHC